ncbi:MAG TPA: hypothetical protein PLH57_11180, partial [Oligoflexia bacterium]|nr:hypothetical protein [Oligoflexia bacterium]
CSSFLPQTRMPVGVASALKVEKSSPSSLAPLLRTFALLVFLFFAVAFTTTIPAEAVVRVAFLTKKNAEGHLLRLHPTGHGFYHVAVSYKGRWLHAHPNGGVQISKSLRRFGQIAAVLEHRKLREPSTRFVRKIRGLPYDPAFRWNEPESFYCSKLLAKHFRLPPTPMTFHGSHWGEYFRQLGLPKPINEVGLSPDEVYDLLIERGFVPR